MKNYLLLLILTVTTLTSCDDYSPYYAIQDNVIIYDLETKESVKVLNEGDTLMIESALWRGSLYPTTVNGKDAYVEGILIRKAPTNAHGEFNYEALNKERSDANMLILFAVIIAVSIIILGFALYKSEKNKTVFSIIGVGVTPILLAIFSFIILGHFFSEPYQTWFCTPSFVGFWWSVLNFFLFTLFVVIVFLAAAPLMSFIIIQTCEFKKKKNEDDNIGETLITMNIAIWIVAMIGWMIITSIWDCEAKWVWWIVMITQAMFFIQGVIETKNRLKFIYLYLFQLVACISFTVMLFYYLYCLVQVVIFMLIAIGVIAAIVLYAALGGLADAVGSKFGGENNDSDGSPRYRCHYQSGTTCRHPKMPSGSYCPCNGNYTLSNCHYPDHDRGTFS